MGSQRRQRWRRRRQGVLGAIRRHGSRSAASASSAHPPSASTRSAAAQNSGERPICGGQAMASFQVLYAILGCCWNALQGQGLFGHSTCVGACDPMGRVPLFSCAGDGWISCIAGRGRPAFLHAAREGPPKAMAKTPAAAAWPAQALPMAELAQHLSEQAGGSALSSKERVDITLQLKAASAAAYHASEHVYLPRACLSAQPLPTSQWQHSSQTGTSAPHEQLARPLLAAAAAAPSAKPCLLRPPQQNQQGRGMKLGQFRAAAC